MGPGTRDRTAEPEVFYSLVCLDLFALMPEASVRRHRDSPPYNLGISYNEYDDRLSQEDYLAWTSTWVAAAAEFFQGRWSLSSTSARSRATRGPAMDWRRPLAKHLHLQNIIHWIKSIAIDRAAAGKPLDVTRSRRRALQADQQRALPHDCHEFVFHFTPQGKDRAQSTGSRRALIRTNRTSRGGVRPGRVFAAAAIPGYPDETIQRRDRDRPHPATFPSRLPEQCLRLHASSASNGQ